MRDLYSLFTMTQSAPEPFVHQTRGRWLDNWHPEDRHFWAQGGRQTALKNLLLSVLAEHIGFNVWVIWTVVVTQMGNAGFEFMAGLDQGNPTAVGNALLLTSVPVLVGAALRIPYTFAVPKFGGRAFTSYSAAMLIIPCLALAYFIGQPDTSLGVFVLLAALAGLGGGNFSSSMANISFFFPDRRKGMALGINAAGGNIGVAVCQLAMPLVILGGTALTAKDPAGYRVGIALAALSWVPMALAASVCAWLFMDSITSAKPDGGSFKRALRTPHTWIMSLLYVGTFGSFIGFSFAFPTLINANFPEFNHVGVMVALGNFAFVGALIGALIRPFGGWLADRWGGARITVSVFGGLSLCVFAVMAALEVHSFALYFGAFLVIFALAGVGNGAAYRMIPVIFTTLARDRIHAEPAELHNHLHTHDEFLGAKRQAAAAVGVIGAIGASGGFLIQQAMRIANSEFGSMTPAFVGFLGLFAALSAVTWWFYLRRSFLIRIPSLAHAKV